MRINVVSSYKKKNKPDIKSVLDIDKNINIYDLRTKINRLLGVKAYYQLISHNNEIMLNNLSVKNYVNDNDNEDNKTIYRIVISEETKIDITSSDEECNSSGKEFVKYVQNEEKKAIERINFIKETISVKDTNNDLSKKIDLDKSVESKYTEQMKILRSMGYLDEIVISNVLDMTNGSVELALNYLNS